MNYDAPFILTVKQMNTFGKFFQTLADRKNTINGTKYKDNPVFMSCQLANKPRAGNNNSTVWANLSAFRIQLEETSALIKSVETNYLVSIRNEGNLGSLKLSDNFFFLHNIPSIDYLTFHLLPAN